MNKIRDLLLIPLIILGVWAAIKWYKTPAFSNGADVPEFVGYLPDRDSIRLSDFKGQLILLDFWGSWCGPCRAKNKELVNIYNKYKDVTFEKESKFDIISIGIETNKERWLAAIEKDGLVWPNHVSDLNRLNDHIALLYGVREIPTTYLLDGEHNIIGVNLNEAQMDEILTHRLKK